MSKPEADLPTAQGDEPLPPDDDLEYMIPPTKARSKAQSRCYNISFIAVYFVLLIPAVVALGSFGTKQNELTSQLRKSGFSTADSCILFIDQNENELHSNKLCGYVFWGLTSIIIVAFVWLINSIVQAAIGLKV